MSDDRRDRVAHAVGNTIRRARGRLGLSMRDVAAKAGVSQPFLSDLENGRAMPSITTLYRLADTLELAPHDLLPAQLGSDVVVVRSGGEPSPIDEAPGMRMSSLIGGAPGRLIEARRYVLDPAMPAGGWFEHDGEDLVFVLAGTIWVEFDTGVEERLQAGDSLWHSGLVPHRWRCEPESGAELVLINGKSPNGLPGDSHHL